jgi:hypothetical protein
MNIVRYYLSVFFIVIYFTFLDLMDFPDSEDDGASGPGDASIEGADILDDDDMEQTEYAGDSVTDQGTVGHPADRRHRTTETTVKGQSCGSSHASSSYNSPDGPDLPPIYRTVRKEKEKLMVTRHLYGGTSTEAASTDNGAAVSKVETIGSFANPGDKRHNHTMHRYDFNNIRNLSTSFNTSTLTCTTCQGEHTVLRREIDGADVGMDTPPVFVLSDQNFPPMVPAGGEGDGECLKVIQVEHGSLAELVDVFLEITKGFSIPAGTILVMASASSMAMYGTADYAKEFVKANIKLRETFSGGVRVVHGVPFLIGGTHNIAAIRTMAEINQWVSSTSGLNQDITATRAHWDALIRTRAHGTDCIHTIRLPISQLKLELGTYSSGGFSNLTAAAPLNEENERSLVLSLIKDLNEIYAAGLCENPIVDRFLEDDVFQSDDQPRHKLLLLGSSHLKRIAGSLDTDKFEVIDLCKAGFRVSEANVKALVAKLESELLVSDMDNLTILVQLLDNSVYQVGGPGGVRYLPEADQYGHYHITGTLQIADKAAVKDMVGILSPVIRAMGHARKIFLTPLARYWLKPCCSNPDHHTNYSSLHYLPALGSNIFRLRDHIRDALYTRRTSNFRVLCPNRMLGLGPALEDEKAREISDQWGSDAVHPLPAAYGTMASAIESDIADPSAKYINAPKSQTEPPAKKPKVDHSKLRQGWVDGCSAALPRRDTVSGPPARNVGPARGKPRGNSGYRPYWAKRGSTFSGRGRSRGRGWRGK